MHTNEPREVEGIDLGYDPRDIQVKPIVKVVIYFFLFTLAFYGVGAYVFIRQGWGARTVFDARKPIFAGPKVQGNVTAKVDIMSMRQAETKALTTYGIYTDAKGVAHQRIPVDHAMDLLAARGLPPIASDQPAKSPGNTIKDNAVGPSTAPSERAPMSPMTGGAMPPAGSTPEVPTRDPGMSAPTPQGAQPSPAGP